MRVFDVAAGVTGWTEKRMRDANKPCASVIVNDHQHATYFPGAKPLTLKLVWDTRDGRVVGAQATGGIVTDWQGGPAWRGGRVLAAANAEIHAAAMAVLNG